MTITLATLHLATEEEVFEQVAKHLLKQNAKSVRDEAVIGTEAESCRYRGLRGKSCAAGCLIAEEEFNYNMEGKDWFGVVNAGYAPKIHEGLIKDLQEVHDCIEVEHWESKLKELGKLNDFDCSFI